MDRFKKRYIPHYVALIASASCLSISTPGFARAGYFQPHNLMSAAQKNIPNNLFFNDQKLNLEVQERDSGHVVNTQFANNGGMAGCGVTSTLMSYMYTNRGTTDLSTNYIALNVYSQVMGFDPQAPFWGDPEGQVKGYLTQGATATNIAYPYTPYHRVIPSIYPAYLGLYNNGLNCGRWVEADFDSQLCTDRTSPTGISKYCPSVSSLSYTGQKMLGYVFDSCEDNNGWCRDDAAHIDVHGAAITANYYLQWKFIKNPYYSDPNAPIWLKDIWLAWFSQASQYWSYIAILNAENGISNVQYNVGNPTNPTWVDSHSLAGDNNVTWSSTSNNGQLWQVEPVNSLTDSAPPSNPVYQLRLFDYLGYPANQGSIYQFNLLFSDGTLGQSVSGYYMFYQGGLAVKPGSQPQNMTILPPPVGTGTITVSFNQLPSNVSLDATQPNYLRPVLISQDGYSWDASSCANNQCAFTNLPTGGTYSVFAHAIEDVSNDLTMRQANDIAINSKNITFPNQTTSVNYTLSASDMNLSTQYSARVQIPLQFATTSTAAINGNLQALFVPDNSKNTANNITAQTQGCFLDNYVSSLSTAQHRARNVGNTSTCTIYYTLNNQSSFSSTAKPPAAFFNVILPTRVGFGSVSFMLDQPYNNPVQVTGYLPASGALPTPQSAPTANYLAGNSSSSRSLYLLLDPASDTACLQNLDPSAGVNVTVGGASVTLTTPDMPIETQLTQPASSISTQVNLVSGAKVSCQAMPAIIPTTAQPLQPGIDVVEVIKLITMPQSLPPKPATQGIAATAAGDAACMGATDTLTFSSNGAAVTSIAYTTSTSATNLGIQAPIGTYTISDQPFNVAGGSCKLSSSPTVTIQSNTYTPVTLNYTFSKTPGGACTATAQVAGSWPNGCNITFAISSSSSSLSNVMLSWQKGAWNWNNAQVWSGEGTLNIPANATSNVSWQLPSWVGSGSTVGMTVNSDGTPSICSAFSGSSINVQCTGTTTSKVKATKHK